MLYWTSIIPDCTLNIYIYTLWDVCSKPSPQKLWFAADGSYYRKEEIIKTQRTSDHMIFILN